MDKIASLSHVRANLPKLIASLGKRGRDRVIITRNGSAAAVLISLEDLETLEILADRKLMLSLRRAEQDIKAGRTFAYADVFSDVRERLRSGSRPRDHEARKDRNSH